MNLAETVKESGENFTRRVTKFVLFTSFQCYDNERLKIKSNGIVKELQKGKTTRIVNRGCNFKYNFISAQRLLQLLQNCTS